MRLGLLRHPKHTLTLVRHPQTCRDERESLTQDGEAPSVRYCAEFVRLLESYTNLFPFFLLFKKHPPPSETHPPSFLRNACCDLAFLHTVTFKGAGHQQKKRQCRSSGTPLQISVGVSALGVFPAGFFELQPPQERPPLQRLLPPPTRPWPGVGFLAKERKPPSLTPVRAERACAGDPPLGESAPTKGSPLPFGPTLNAFFDSLQFFCRNSFFFCFSSRSGLDKIFSLN